MTLKWWNWKKSKIIKEMIKFNDNPEDYIFFNNLKDAEKHFSTSFKTVRPTKIKKVKKSLKKKKLEIYIDPYSWVLSFDLDRFNNRIIYLQDNPSMNHYQEIKNIQTVINAQIKKEMMEFFGKTIDELQESPQIYQVFLVGYKKKNSDSILILKRTSLLPKCYDCGWRSGVILIESSK